MKLEWRPRALADVQALRGRVAREQPAAAARVAGRILAAAELLSMYPELGRAGRASGTRELAVARTRYLLIYRYHGDSVTILRVLHGAQNWP